MMVPNALIAQHALFLVPTRLHALALLTSTGMRRLVRLVAKLALLALMHLLDPLASLRVFARPTTSELETELHAVCALVVEPLLSKRQSQLLPLRTLTALARQTSMGMVPHALIALLVLMHLLDPLPLLLAFARPTTSELETELHAPFAPTVEPLLSKQQSQLLPLRTLTVLARRTHMEPTLRLDALPVVHRITRLVDPNSLLIAHALPL
jgi:hypothetical protein